MTKNKEQDKSTKDEIEKILVNLPQYKIKYDGFTVAEHLALFPELKQATQQIEDFYRNKIPEKQKPDEDGVYDYNEMIDQAESQIKAWIEENVIGEDPPINTGDKQLDMVNANRILMLRDQRQQLREEK